MTEKEVLEVASKMVHIGPRTGFAKSIYTEANKMPKDCRILDIGGFMGGSSITMALTVKDRGGLVYTINPSFTPEGDKNKKYLDMGMPLAGDLDSFMGFVKTFGAEGYVIPLIGSSEEILAKHDGSLFDMVFIDAWHVYEATKIDVKWLDYTKENAIAQFDDFAGGVEKAATEYFSEHKEWKRITDQAFYHKHGVAVFQKGDF